VDPRLQALIDKEAVIAVIDRLFIATDRRDWPAVRDCFGEMVRFDMTSLAGGEPTTLAPAEITSAWEEGLASLDAIHHQSGNHTVALSGDEADASCYGIAMHFRGAARGGTTRTFVGSYDFHLVRHQAAWRIDRFTFHCKFVDGNRALEQD